MLLIIGVLPENLFTGFTFIGILSVIPHTVIQTDPRVRLGNHGPTAPLFLVCNQYFHRKSCEIKFAILFRICHLLLALDIHEK